MIDEINLYCFGYNPHMSLSLTTQTRLAQFTARFIAQPDGSYIYFHPDGREGLPCSATEAAQLLAEFANAHHDTMRYWVYWVLVSGAVMGGLEASGVLRLPTWAQWTIFLMPLLFIVRAWHHAQQRPLHYLQGRIPVATRTSSHAVQSRIAALPAHLIAMLLFPAAGLTYYALTTGWVISNALIVGSNILLAVAWLIARWRIAVQ